jgi:peptide chain release factor 1
MNNNPYQAQIDQISTKIQESQKILSDPDLGDLAQQEIEKLQQQLETLKKAAADYQESLEEQEEAQKKPTVKSNAILELRAGAGGDEAKIWANDLLRMYTRYCENKNLKIEFVDDLVIKISHNTKLKLTFTDPQTNQEQTLEKTFYAYELLKHEAGVHRVQRVPTTETQGRIHTSTASVAILPEIKSHEIKIRDEDLHWEFMRSSGAGGQSVNKTSSAVRLIHEPSGIVVRVSQERKQLQNRAIALELLRSQLWTIEEEKRVNKIENARLAIGKSMRAEKIRTYNFPQNRVTDHRINESWHQLDSILEGELDPIIATIKQKLISEENKFAS